MLEYIKSSLPTHSQGDINYKKVVVYLITAIIVPVCFWILVDFKNNVALANDDIKEAYTAIDVKYAKKVNDLEEDLEDLESDTDKKVKRCYKCTNREHENSYGKK